MPLGGLFEGVDLNNYIKEMYSDNLDWMVPMSDKKKFKPGDKVKFIKKYEDYPIGTITTIKKVIPDGYYIDKPNAIGYFFEKDFELVEEKIEAPVKKIDEGWGNW